MEITFVGAGNLSWHLAPALESAGHHINEVYSRQLQHARQLVSNLYDARTHSDLNFADTDLVRMDDRRFIAVIREIAKKEAWIAFSDDEARTWHGLRKAPFRGANIKLFRLRDGSILCAYRDEDPARHGVSVSHSRDGGETWRWLGQLYSDSTADHRPGGLCGYPDMVSLGDGRIAATLHTYTKGGRAHLQFFILRDRT